MSKLDEILDNNQPVELRTAPRRRQALKDLMLELVGEDELERQGVISVSNIEKFHRNELRAELRRKVDAL